jgi:crotonobetainyl-CoA:carnitine CoA-transferase CaiB-like acyl-CoA transferase
MGREETDPMRLPLEDVTVIDLSHALAGPFCSAVTTLE